MFVNDRTRTSLYDIHSKVLSLIESKMPTFRWDPDGDVRDDEPNYYTASEIVGQEEDYDPAILMLPGGRKRTVYELKEKPREKQSGFPAPTFLDAPAVSGFHKDDEAWDYFYNHFLTLAQDFTWDFVSSNKHKAEVLMPTGGSAAVSAELFRRPDNETGPANTHIDVRIGTVGSGHLKYLPSLGKESHGANSNLRILYGAQLYQPITFAGSDFGRFFEDLKKAKLDIPMDYDALLVHDILTLSIEGRWNKQEIKQKLAPNLKDASWNVIWADATRENVKLGKPGPKGGPKLSFNVLKTKLKTVRS